MLTDREEILVTLLKEIDGLSLQDIAVMLTKLEEEQEEMELKNEELVKELMIWVYDNHPNRDEVWKRFMSLLSPKEIIIED